MGLFLRQDEQRTEVQQRVAAELQDRLRQSAGQQKETEPAFLENQHTTRNAGMIIIILVALLSIAVGVLVFRIS